MAISMSWTPSALSPGYLASSRCSCARFVHRIGVEQLAELGVANQLAQLRLIDGSACARRSASGASPSYRKLAT
jgi:hypothetical protein